MRKFRAGILQNNDLPWRCWDDEAQTRTRPMVWGETLIPAGVYAEYDPEGNPVGDPIYFQWTALLPTDVQLPDWITETTAI